MESRSEQIGQTEIGTVAHGGHEWSALGASVHGRHVTGYTHREKDGPVVLKRWSGGTMLACRSEVVETYWHEYLGNPVALVFSLTGKRYIVGYALDPKGMLFRGELTECSDFSQAAHEARATAEYWADRDAEDEERQEYEDSLEREREEEAEEERRQDEAIANEEHRLAELETEGSADDDD